MTYTNTVTGTTPVGTNLNVKERIKGLGAAAFWTLLFLGGMLFGALAVMLVGVYFDIDFVVDGIYAMNDFYVSIGTDGFGEAVEMLADKAAVFIHTTMCIGYLPVIVAMFIRRKEQGGFGELKVSETSEVFKWVAISMAASFVLDLLMQLAATIPYFAEQAATLSSVGVLSTAGLPWLALLTTGVLAPIVEEIAFRRGIQKAMTEKFNPVVGIATSALVFGVAHGNLFQGVFAALMGVILGYVYHKTGNLWYTTIIHIVNNSACVLISLLGLNSIVIGMAIPAVAALGYFATRNACSDKAVAEAVAYLRANYAAENVEE